MSKDKMTPLSLTTNPLEAYGNDEVATIWQDNERGTALIASLSGSPGRERGQQFGKELVSAYNNTYGQNINPEAVPDLLYALKIARNYIEYAIMKGAIGECQKDLARVKAAIEKAKII